MQDDHLDVGRAIVRITSGTADDRLARAAEAAAELCGGDLVLAMRTGAGPTEYEGAGVDLSSASSISRPLVAWLHDVDTSDGPTGELATIPTRDGDRDVLLVAAGHGRTTAGLAVLEPQVDDTTSRVVGLVVLLAELFEQAAREAEDREAEDRGDRDAEHVLLGAASHELRTPLTIIMGLASTLESRHADLEPEMLGELLGRMVDNARRMNRLVDDLMTVASLRLDGGDVVHGRRQQLDEVVSRAVAGLPDEVVDRVELDVEPATAVLDEPMVERVVEHLVGNAVKYTGEGSGIDVRVRQVPGGAVLSVLDRGHGVRPDLRKRIFDPFGRGEGLVSHSPGMGIGLTLVREVAIALGGNAWVTDREDGQRGAAFHVRLLHPASVSRLPRPVRETLDDVTTGLGALDLEQLVAPRAA